MTERHETADQRTPQPDFAAAYARICEALAITTQVELAERLRIRQSSISDAKRRGSLPAEWLVTLCMEYGLHPAWVLTGKGGRYAVDSSDPGQAKSELRQVVEAELRPRIEAELRERPIALQELIARLREEVPGIKILIGPAPAEASADPLARQTAEEVAQ